MYKQIKLIVLLLLLVQNALAQEAKTDAENGEPIRILISGSLSPQGMERIGKPISIVNEKDIKKQGGNTIGETVGSLPGVSSSGFGPGSSRPVIRSHGKERVRVLENGLENGDVSAASDDHAVGADPLATERIDILRGPSTLLYGSQAIGGVVNIIDGSIKEESVGKDFTGAIDLMQGNSADENQTGAVKFEGQSGKLNWHLSTFYRETDDIEIPGFAESAKLRGMEELELGHEEEHAEGHEDEHETEQKGTLENSDTLSRGFKAGLSHVWEDGFVGFAVRHTKNRYGVPGGHDHGHAHEAGEVEDQHEDEEHHDEEESPVRIDMEQTRYETRGAVKLYSGFFDTVRFGAAFSDYNHKELEGKEVGTEYDRKAFETRMLLTHKHDDFLEGGWGFQFNYDDMQVSGLESFIPDTKTTQPAVFFLEDFSLNKNTVWQVGGRYEYVGLDPVRDYADKDFDIFSASTGLIWHTTPKTYSTALNLSFSERAPNSAELYADGVHAATRTYEVGDSELDKERSLGLELILRKLKGSFRGSLTGFWQDFDNYINLAPTGREDDGVQVYNYTDIEAEFWGFEAESELDLIHSYQHNLVFYNSLDFVRAENKSDDTNLPRVTPLRGKLGLRYEYDQVKTYVEAMLVDSQTKTAPYELGTDSYALLNAGLSYDIPVKEGVNIELYARGTNLTDEEARLHTSFLKDQAPLRGRAFFAGLLATF